jgi:hypothetical protein
VFNAGPLAIHNAWLGSSSNCAADQAKTFARQDWRGSGHDRRDAAKIVVRKNRIVISGKQQLVTRHRVRKAWPHRTNGDLEMQMEKVK